MKLAVGLLGKHYGAGVANMSIAKLKWLAECAWPKKFEEDEDDD